MTVKSAMSEPACHIQRVVSAVARVEIVNTLCGFALGRPAYHEI